MDASTKGQGLDRPSAPHHPLITISMTVFNTPAHLVRRAIRGLLEQTFTRWTLVVVNDGGNPACVDSAMDGIDDPRIRVVHHTSNLGTYARHAQTLVECKTDWWSPHDSDDYCTNDRYESLWKASYPVDRPADEYVGPSPDAVLSGYTNIGVDGSTCQMQLPEEPREGTGGTWWCRELTIWGATLWSVRWLRSMGGIDSSYRTSYDSVLQTLLLRFGTVARANNLGYFRQLRHESLTQCADTNSMSGYRMAANRHIADKFRLLEDGLAETPFAELDIPKIMNTGTFMSPLEKREHLPIRIVTNTICLDSAPELPDMLNSLLRDGRRYLDGVGSMLVDGVVVVDGGSADGSANVVRRWGADRPGVRVETVPWEDDFAKQRNHCIDLTRREFGVSDDTQDIWVLAIDSDDTLADFDRGYLESVIRTHDVDAIQVTLDSGTSSFTNTLLFRLTEDTRWSGPIHEFVKVGGYKALPTPGKVRIRLGWGERHNMDPQRNVRIGRRLVEAEPSNARARFYLSRDLIECTSLPYMERMAEAEGHLRVYRSLPQKFLGQDRNADLLLCRVVWELGRSDEARQIMHDRLLNDPDCQAAYKALANMATSKAEAAIWDRLADTVQGECVLPYGKHLPAPRR